MLRLLTTISWRHVRHHRLRTVLTFCGIALGVAVIIAIALVNRSLTTSFQSTIDQIAGKAVLQIANSESGMAESVFPPVRDTAGVRDVAAAVDGFLPVRGEPGERLYIYGVESITDFTIRDYHFAGDRNSVSTRPWISLPGRTPSPSPNRLPAVWICPSVRPLSYTSQGKRTLLCAHYSKNRAQRTCSVAILR